MSDRAAPRPPICAVVVTHHPDAGWPDRFAAACAESAAAVVVDNGSDAAEVEMIEREAARGGAHLIANPTNVGLAAALNQGAEWGWRQGARWLLLLDQDTQPMAGIGRELLRVYGLASAGGAVAIVGSNYSDRHTGRVRYAWPLEPAGGWMPRKTVITSGALIEREAWAAIGPFREEFFVDSVDHDFCLRARSKGYQVVMTTRPLMRHAIGPGAARTILGITTSNHPPRRRYSMVRNRVVLARQYLFREPRWVMANLWGLFTESALAVLVERDRASKLRSVVTGAWDGAFSRLGGRR